MRLSKNVSFMAAGCASLALVLLAGSVARAANNDEARSGNSQSSSVQTAQDTIRLDGRGRQASQKFNLQPGLAVFKTTHDGSSNLIIRLLNHDGQAIDTLFNQIGKFDGERGFEIREAGEYLLDVAADGNWTVAIEQPRPTEGYTIPRTLEGHGYGVTPFIQLEKGLKVFKMRHNGSGRFSVYVMDQDGRKVEGLVNVPGKFDGSKPISLENPGIYFLNVAGDGDWSISVE